MSFTGALTLTEMPLEWQSWRLESNLVYLLDGESSARAIIVPKGFITDGASIPRPLWWLLPAWGRYSRAAVVHDYLCILIGRGAPHVFAPDRRAADAIFYQAMVICGVNRTMRLMMWGAVRLYAILARK